MCCMLFSTTNAIVLLTPRANESYIGRNLSVIVEYSGRVDQKVKLFFTYTGNPTIADIQPRVLSILLVLSYKSCDNFEVITL